MPFSERPSERALLTSCLGVINESDLPSQSMVCTSPSRFSFVVQKVNFLVALKYENIMKQNWDILLLGSPVTVAERSQAWTVFARSDAVIVGSNPTRGMDVYIFVRFSVFVLTYI
jgi:hypothetical protein